MIKAYEAEHLWVTAQIVQNNRVGRPERVIDLVEERAPGGFAHLDEVASQVELEAIVKGLLQDGRLRPDADESVERERGERGTSMTERTPTETTNLDRYGSAALPWSRPHDLLATSASAHTSFFLGTVQPDGRPHAAAVGALWHDGDLYIVSGPQTRKSRNLAANPACTISVGLEGIDLVLEGQATSVIDQPTLEAVARLYRETGWPAQVEGDAFTAPYSAPSAGPPPWYLYRFVFYTAFGVATAEPHGATRWRFKR